MSVANQDIVRVGKRAAYDKDNLFCRTHLDALQEAMCKLKGETLKLWLYLNKNQDNYQLELSQKACEEWGLKKDAYYTAKKKLMELGYLTPIREGSNIYIFHESLSEKPNEPDGDSEKPKSSSEKPKNFSEKPQRNTTNTTIIQQQEVVLSADADKTTLEGVISPVGESNPQPEAEEKEEPGTLINPIPVSREWLIERHNHLTKLANGLFMYGSKFYKLAAAAD